MYSKIRILTTEISQVALPVALARSLSILTEVAVKQRIVQSSGYKVIAEFCNKQRQILEV